MEYLTLTSEAVEIPAFRYRGFDIPALDVPEDLIANLGTSEPAHLLAPKSPPLAWRVGLYVVGRDLSLDEEDAEMLPEPVRQAGRVVYDDCQARTEPGKGSGTWHRDAVLFEPGTSIKGNTRPGKDYVAARILTDLEGFEEISGEWVIKASPDTKESRMWVPLGSGHFIVPTGDGAYDRETGIPNEVISNKSKAIKRWTEAGLTDEQAGRELTRFYSGDGLRAVRSWSYDDNGPLCILLGVVGWSRDSYFGLFTASSSAEPSEAPKNSGFRMITEEEYNSYEADRQKLEAVREAAQE